jgi:acetyltransferase-like isoleucine patch superfamily enzyme
MRNFLRKLLGRGASGRVAGGRERGPKRERSEEADLMGKGSLVRGRLMREKPGGVIRIGRDCLIEGLVKTESEEGRIEIGNNVYLGGGSSLSAARSIRIMDDVLISYRVIVMDSDSHSVRYSVRKKDLADWKDSSGHDWSTTESGEVVIGKGAWLGAGSMVLKGVTIGEGAIVGAGSVVTKDVSAWTIVAGNPARKIRELGEDER